MSKKLKIAFITKETIVKHIYAPIAMEAQRRGHSVLISDDPSVDADIGFYSDDNPVPGNQKLRLVTINGLDQDHASRPNYASFFSSQNWHKFDVGILPGPRWSIGWISSMEKLPGKPSRGVFEVGWPKSDALFSNGDPVLERLNRPAGRNILYAPQTEQDGKQSVVLNQLQGKNCNLTIKHWESESYYKMPEYAWLLTEAYKNNMNKENERASSFPWVKILDPESNFMEALSHCDILISDQSSVIYEAALVGAPTITVNGWKHACGDRCGIQPSPDVCAVVEPDGLGDIVEEIFCNYNYWVNKAINIRNDNFVNLGFGSIIVVDLIESIFSGESFPDSLTILGKSCRYGEFSMYSSLRKLVKSYAKAMSSI
jgi:hypothetical protein